MAYENALATITNKPGLLPAVRSIVIDALSKDLGGTLQKNSIFESTLGLGAGTIQRAISLLADQDALVTQSRGHLGRQIQSINIGICWHLAQLKPIQIIISPTGAMEMDALEESIAADLADLDLPYTIEYVPGGEPRLHALSKGDSDLTIVSAGTLELYSQKIAKIPQTQIKVLSPGSYYSPERLVVLTKTSNIATPATIAVDPESHDHKTLTFAEFPQNEGFKFVDISYPEVPAYVLAGVVDAGIWRVTKSPIPLDLAGLTSRPLHRENAKKLLDDYSRAVLVRGSNRPEIKAVLENLKLQHLFEHQNKAEKTDRLARNRLDQARKNNIQS